MYSMIEDSNNACINLTLVDEGFSSFRLELQ